MDLEAKHGKDKVPLHLPFSGGEFFPKFKG
jgi:hypothetical protein